MNISYKIIKLKVGMITSSQLLIKYHNIIRIIEPHVLGYDNKNQILLRAFEVKKDKIKTDQLKLYLVSDIESINYSDIKFSRKATKPTDEVISKIIMTTYNGKKKEENS